MVRHMLTSLLYKFYQNSKMSDFAHYQQQYPESYTSLFTRLNQITDSFHNTYFHSIAAKQNSWFGSTMIHLVLQQPEHIGTYQLYYQKHIHTDLHLNYQPDCEIVKRVSLEKMKMVARNGHKLTVAFVENKRNLAEWILQFSTEELAKEWERLLTEKRNQAREVSKNRGDKDLVIKKLVQSISTLEKELSKLRGECNRLLQQNAVIKQENIDFRGLVHSLGNQIILQKSQALNENTMKLTNSRRERLDRGRKDEKEQHLKKIEDLIEQMRNELASNQDGISKRLLERLTKQIKRQLNIYRNFNTSRNYPGRSYSNPRLST